MHPPEFSGNNLQRHLAAKQKKFGEKITFNITDEVSLSYFAGIFNMP
jgi:hypothetical protein